MNWPDFWNGFFCVVNMIALTSGRQNGAARTRRDIDDGFREDAAGEEEASKACADQRQAG